MGYHQVDIQKGVLGEFSKITEEYNEAFDGWMQGNDILILCELSDMIGAIEEYINRYNLTIENLKEFSDLTKSAFKDGKRK